MVCVFCLLFFFYVVYICFFLHLRLSRNLVNSAMKIPLSLHTIVIVYFVTLHARSLYISTVRKPP